MPRPKSRLVKMLRLNTKAQWQQLQAVKETQTPKKTTMPEETTLRSHRENEELFPLIQQDTGPLERFLMKYRISVSSRLLKTWDVRW